MPEPESTHQKALAINLDSSKYGTIAEIGAGQEVARWFFRVGAAAGTIAKSVSAYDMAVSDEIYGKSSRYVSRDRIDAMLDIEYERLLDRLGPGRGADTTFFAFANTVSARNYQGTNAAHGWMGVRFQIEPRSAPSTVRLHLGLLDPTNQLQQEAVGILGVNLIHSAFLHRESSEDFLARLLDGLSIDRLEVDHVDLSGPAFEDFPDDLGFSLVVSGAARAVVWSPESATHDPMSVLYGRPVVIERGSFAVQDPAHETLMKAALERIGKEAAGSRRTPVGLYELSLANPALRVPLSHEEAERRLGDLRALERPVLLTNISESFNFTTYLKRFTKEPIRLAVGMSNVVHVFHEAYHTTLDGGVLAAIAVLLSADVKLYVLPQPVEQVREVAGKLEGGTDMWAFPESGEAKLENTEPTTRLRHLYHYMRETGTLVTLQADLEAGE